MPKSASARRVACLECRLHKIRCRLDDDEIDGSEQACLRCRQYGFACTFAPQNKRGRKPKSKLQQIVTARRQGENSSTTPDIDTIAANSAPVAVIAGRQQRIRRKAWQTLTTHARMRGSKYTFVAAGDTELRHNERTSAGLTTAIEIPPTLRQLLCRVDRQFDGHGSTSVPLPASHDFEAASDPRAAGILTQDECDDFKAYYTTHLYAWVGLIFPQEIFMPQTTAWPQGFLVSVACYLASHFKPCRQHARLAAHVRSLAVQALAKEEKKLETVLALNLLAVWKTADDNYSDQYVRQADQLAAVPDLLAEHRSDVFHKEQYFRTRIFHYIQRSVFALHSGSSARPLTPPRRAIEQISVLDSRQFDWLLCADAESTAIQCKYKTLFKQQARWGARHAALSCVVLLDAFLDEMRECEARWNDAGNVEPCWEEHQNKDHKRVRWSAYVILGKSVSMHITSIAFRCGLDAWRDAEAGGSTSAPQECSPLDDAANELVQRSYALCIDSAVGLLNVVPSLRLMELKHMPDSIMILINHAALLAVYLLLAPAAVAQGLKPRMSTASSSSSLPPSVWSRYDDGGIMERRCMIAIEHARQALQGAAQAESGGGGGAREDLMCSLSAEHLASLVDLMREDDGDDNDTIPTLHQHDSAVNQARTDGDSSCELPSAHIPFGGGGGENLGWDWLQMFLDDATTLPLFFGQQPI